ncbi:hypothetical protein CISIN_1g040220mg, partial [Citrus sinensis]
IGTSFGKFVKVKFSDNPYENEYDGFCIELYYESQLACKGISILFFFLQLMMRIRHEENFLRNYDSVVGDATILADRAKIVEFTQPCAESRLSMIVPAKTEESAWRFMKPCTWEMWVVTDAILVNTRFVVWFPEHQRNSEFNGPRKDQIGTALWFNFSSILFAYGKEHVLHFIIMVNWKPIFGGRIDSNLTRLVVVVWLFVVLILTSSYTASPSPMLTVQPLRPNPKVACDRDSFVRNYLQNFGSDYNYQGEFGSNHIAGPPYEKVFVSQYCRIYAATTPTYGFGGLGFLSSPIAADFSEAILKLSENKKLKSLEYNEKELEPPGELYRLLGLLMYMSGALSRWEYVDPSNASDNLHQSSEDTTGMQCFPD